ncbi:fatty acyl-AMP ligase [Streptomyces buecherae]|uniref:fatty acyl-AMP ligase n=1 Tax=Streptomyces buecherae TaxID=2763006 RepID=UPI0036534D7B
MNTAPSPAARASGHRDARPFDARTIVEALLIRATGPHADEPLLTALDAGGEPVERLTAAGLDTRARAVAAALLAVGGAGDRVIVPAMPGLDFHVGFVGCLYAGMIAVPVPAFRASVARGSARADRLSAICGDCAPCAVLVSSPQVAEAADPDRLPSVAWVAVREAAGPTQAADSAALPDPAALDPDTTALLQYTSGSTGDPRGVIVGHGNLVANQTAMRDRCEVGPATTIVSWLPCFHDMGLCTGVVLPLVSGARTVSIEPAAFVRDPRVWLRAIAGEDDVFTAAPDFAYDLCVARVSTEERAAIDLASWRVAINGSEPVRAATQRRFAAAFEASSFRAAAFSPGFGLAECTLGVSLSPSLVPTVVAHYDRGALAEGKAVPVAPSDDGVELVGCGPALERTDIRVVDPHTRSALPEGGVGEIWVHAPGNCRGYWGRARESEEVFAARIEGADPEAVFVRTGDLGFLEGGELFITGRIKDLLIIGGENYFPQDAEAVATEAHPAFAHQRAAAWPRGADDREVAVVLETTERDPERLAVALRAAGIAVAKAIPATITLYAVARNKIPRTTSGKVRRRECGRQTRAGQLTPLGQWSSTA